MRILILSLILVPFLGFSKNQKALTTMSELDIINSVNNSIDKDDCGAGGISDAVVGILDQKLEDELNDLLDEALGSWDMDCLEGLLMAGISGWGRSAQSSKATRGLCSSLLGRMANNPKLYQTEKGKALKKRVEENVKKQEEFINNVKDW
jgi:hypothetical protein